MVSARSPCFQILHMGSELAAKKDQELAAGGAAGVPSVVLAAGRKAILRFIEFFTANIPIPNTRRAYHRACCEFFRWCESREFERIGPVRAPPRATRCAV